MYTKMAAIRKKKRKNNAMGWADCDKGFRTDGGWGRQEAVYLAKDTSYACMMMVNESPTEQCDPDEGMLHTSLCIVFCSCQRCGMNDWWSGVLLLRKVSRRVVGFDGVQEWG